MKKHKMVITLVIISLLIGIGVISRYYYKRKYIFINVEKDYQVFKMKPSLENLQEIDKSEKEIYNYISSLDKN